MYFLLFLAIAVSFRPSIPTADKILGVCDLAERPEAYSGKKITVRGTIIWEYHGLFLAGSPCKDYILLETPATNRESKELTQEREETLERLWKIVRDSKPGSTNPKVEATFQGRFNSAYRIVNGKRVRGRSGYGHQRAFMLRLVFETIRDLKVTSAGGLDVSP